MIEYQGGQDRNEVQNQDNRVVTNHERINDNEDTILDDEDKTYRIKKRRSVGVQDDRGTKGLNRSKYSSPKLQKSMKSV